MLVNKCALGGALACIMDPKTDIIMIEPDGTIVASNRLLLYVAEPVRPEVFQRVPFGDRSPLREGCILLKREAELLHKSITRDTMFKGVLEHASLTLGAGMIIKVEVRNGQQSSSFEIRRINRLFGDWKSFLRKVWKERCTMAGGQWIHNRARLIGATAALEAACKYDGIFSPVFCERSGKDKILWRAVNELTGQRVWIVFTFAEIKEKWLGLDGWEQKVTGGIPLIRRK